MIDRSHMTESRSSHGIGVIVASIAFWPVLSVSSLAADADEFVETDAAIDQAITIDEAQVLRIQDVVVGSPVSGLVSQVQIREGASVSKGMPLVELNSDRARKELTAAKAAYEAALIQSENDVNTRYAQRTLEVRKRELKQSTEANQRYAGSVTATEIDRLQLVIDQAILSVEQAQQELDVAMATVNEKAAAVDLAQLRVQEHSIVSINNGRIAEVAVQAGQWIEPGAPVARIVSLDPIRISAFVDGRRYSNSLVGRLVEFEWKAGDGETPIKLVGEVTFVSDELNPVTSQVRLWAEARNPDEKIRPGMRGKLVIQPTRQLPRPSGEVSS